VKALVDAGHYQADNMGGSSFLLIDIDVLARRRYINHYEITGEPVFLYPHTGRPVLQWDGMYEPHPHVTAIFTIAQGGADIPRKYGFTEKPIHPVGWTFCELKPFQPCEYPKKVLYAPIHVNGNGFMTKRERLTNAEAFKKLLKVDDIELTVRYLHYLEWNGLWEADGVTYVQGEPDQSTKEIDEADVVISHQNMGYLAVARGKPTLFMAEDNVPISGSSPTNVMTVKMWEKYKDDIMFPLDILKGDTRELLNEAGKDNNEVAKWREKFIGEPFDPALFVRTLESYL
jgi:hypothetical protein